MPKVSPRYIYSHLDLSLTYKVPPLFQHQMSPDSRATDQFICFVCTRVYTSRRPTDGKWMRRCSSRVYCKGRANGSSDGSLRVLLFTIKTGPSTHLVGDTLTKEMSDPLCRGWTYHNLGLVPVPIRLIEVERTSN